MHLRARLAAAATLGGLVLLLPFVLAACGCARRAAPRATSFLWIAGRPEPDLDPTAPPDPLGWAVQRLLARGLTDVDSGGAAVPACAGSWEWSRDSLGLTFRLRPGLAFADGRPCRAADFVEALERGLDSREHGTKRWLLDAVAGVRDVRIGRPLPRIGFRAPDESTIEVALARRDPDLPRKLALPGVSAPWSGAGGVGPYRLARAEAGRSLVLARRAGSAGPDTITIRFQPSAARVLTFLRGGAADLVWPLPAVLDPRTPPAGHRLASGDPRPARALLLVMRADLPPTSRRETRRALAHAVNRDRVLEVLGPRGSRLEEWIPGAGRYDFPALDETAVRAAMDGAKLGRAFHVVLGFDADGAGSGVARVLQGDWARLGIYAELRPLRGRPLEREMLAGLSHLILVEAQPWTDDSCGVLPLIVMPLRGPAAGSFRTGWRTREFDACLVPGTRAPALPAAGIQDRVRDELVALPLARLPWIWLERRDRAPLPFHPLFGPDPLSGAFAQGQRAQGVSQKNPR